MESFHTHRTYALGYILCETLNTINICANVYITDRFLGGSFLTYGIEVIRYRRYRYQSNPMEVIFPRLAKCNFFKYGPSGTVQSVDAMCILPQNVLNEKIYLFLWFWFIVLAVASVFALFYRLAVIARIITQKTIPFNAFKFANNKQIMSTFITRFHVRY